MLVIVVEVDLANTLTARSFYSAQGHTLGLRGLGGSADGCLLMLILGNIDPS